MTTVAETFDLALRHHQAGDFRQAEQLYREILHVEPSHFDALHLLGLLAHQAGRSDLAIDYISQALRLKPDFSYAHNNLGAALRQQGRLAEAMACFAEAVRLQPTNVDAQFNLGIAFQEQGRRDEAAACLREALRLRPDFAEVGNNLGNLLREQGKWAEAEATLQQALRFRPDFAAAHYNLGLTFHEQGKLAEAAASYRQAVSLQPDFADAYNNMGEALRSQNRLEEAIASFEQALRLVPGHLGAHYNLGLLLKEAGQPEQADAHWQECLRLQPTPALRVLRATLLPAIYQSREEILTWRHRFADNIRQLNEENFHLDLTEQTVAPPFLLTYQGLNDRDLQGELTRLFTAPAEPSAPAIPVRARGKIKVGFISCHFRDHSVSVLLRGVIAQLARDLFSVTVLSVGSPRDAIARFIQEHADVYLEVPAHLPAARSLIARQQLDVLFYTDIGMDPVTYTLAFSRLAPVQCTTWGHGASTGIKTIDYFISSELLETEEGDQHYTERLVRLPNLGIYFYRPEPPAPLKGRAQCGLPEEGHLYACFQSHVRFHPDFDAVLGGILRRDPRGVLVLLEGKWQELLQRRFAATLPDVAERIMYLPPRPHDEFLNLKAKVDVLLDPLHISGGRASYEALALGVPIVTLPTAILRGRLTLALYRQMGVEDCIVNSPEEYVDRAVRLGTDPDYRAAVRAKILETNGILFENPAGVRDLEQFLQQAVAAGNGATDETRIKHG